MTTIPPLSTIFWWTARTLCHTEAIWNHEEMNDNKRGPKNTRINLQLLNTYVIYGRWNDSELDAREALAN